MINVRRLVLRAQFRPRYFEPAPDRGLCRGKVGRGGDRGRVVV